MKSKKVTMLVAALVVAVVALAGVGYATISTYKATTDNTNNTLTSTYITMTQDGIGKYNQASFLTGLYYDSVTNYVNTAEEGQQASWQEVIDYIPICGYILTPGDEQTGTTITASDNGNLAKISTDLDLVIDSTQSSATDKITLEITVTKFTQIDGLDYIFVIEKDDAVVAYVSSADPNTEKYSYTEPTGQANDGVGVWTFKDLALTTTASQGVIQNEFTVSMYVGLSSGTDSLAAVNSSAGFTNPGQSEEGSVFTFVAIASM